MSDAILATALGVSIAFASARGDRRFNIRGATLRGDGARRSARWLCGPISR